jgi:hypothetical protein
MSLSPEQKQAVAAWIAAGDNLSTVQQKLAAEFKISLTYRDVRFLVDDLNLELKDPAPKVDASDVSKTPAPVGGGPASRAPRPAPGEPAEKRGLFEKLKEKVGMGAEPAEEDELTPEALADADAEDLPAAPPAGPGGVTLELDRLVRPGFMASGTVAFSDGVSGKWALDQMGRLMLETPQKGYKPSQEDVMSFQRELQAQLQRQGY